MRFDEHFLKGVIPESELLHKNIPKDAQFSIDTRTLQPGDIFIAIQGEQLDGHTFIQEAIAGGAAGLIINKAQRSVLETCDAKKLSELFVFAVPDTLQALLRMASAWRAHFNYPVVGVTGSVGKTTTKALIASILQLHGTECIVSRENQNTRIGAALNILRMRKEHKAAIFEMGISERGDMVHLADLVRPTLAVITNIGHSHMEGIGSIQDVAQEKRMIFHYFTEENIGIINGDQPLLADVGYVHPVIKFGSKTINQIQARKVSVSSQGVRFVLKVYKEKCNVTIKTPHLGLVNNALAAASVAYMLNVPSAIIAQGLSQSVVTPGRFEPKRIKNKRGVLINDSYNANPESMKLSLMAFQQLDKQGSKIAVLGDMLELGVNSPFWHRQLGHFLRKVPSLKRVILVGNMVEWTKKTLPVGLPIDHVADWKEAVTCLENCLTDDSLVFVKGSNGMQLNKLVAAVCQD